MAKTVGYFEDNNDEMYSEGPYVLTGFMQGYRVEKRGPKCPVLPPIWVYDLRKLLNIPDGWQPYETLAPFVDMLNWAHLLCESWKK